MNETFVLILLVIVMLIGSYLAGSIPLVVSLSEVMLLFLIDYEFYHVVQFLIEKLSLIGKIKNCHSFWGWFISWNRINCYYTRRYTSII